MQPISVQEKDGSSKKKMCWRSDSFADRTPPGSIRWLVALQFLFARIRFCLGRYSVCPCAARAFPAIPNATTVSAVFTRFQDGLGGTLTFEGDADTND